MFEKLLNLLGLGERAGIARLVMSYLTGSKTAGGGGESPAGGGESPAGGLGGLVDKFKGAGLGGLVQSWIGAGPNQAVSPDQVKQVVGGDKLSEMAAKLGIPVDQVAGKLAKYLPGIIDKMTPGGKLPDA